MQVGMPAATKPNTQEAGANLKCFYSDTGNLEEGGIMLQSPSWEDGECISKPISWGNVGLRSQSPSPHLRGGRGFYKNGERNRTKRSREWTGKFFTCRLAQSIPIRQVMVRCTLSWLRPPDSMDEGQQISRSWDAWSLGSVSFEVSS